MIEKSVTQDNCLLFLRKPCDAKWWFSGVIFLSHIHAHDRFLKYLFLSVQFLLLDLLNVNWCQKISHNFHFNTSISFLLWLFHYNSLFSFNKKAKVLQFLNETKNEMFSSKWNQILRYSLDYPKEMLHMRTHAEERILFIFLSCNMQSPLTAICSDGSNLFLLFCRG